MAFILRHRNTYGAEQRPHLSQSCPGPAYLCFCVYSLVMDLLKSFTHFISLFSFSLLLSFENSVFILDHACGWSLSHVQLFVTPRTVSPLSMTFPRQEC